MKMVQAKVTVGADRVLTVQLPDDVTTGEYSVTVLLHPAKDQFDRPAIMADWPVIDVGPWPEGLSLRREDMYDDDGR
jgi:hypothetical protein